MPYYPASRTAEPCRFCDESGRTQLTVTTIANAKVTHKLNCLVIKIETLSSSASGEQTATENKVKMLHYTGWPDLAVPEAGESIKGFTALVKQLLTHYTEAGSDVKRLAIVHCRLGHGRTGTLLTLFSRYL